MRTRHMKILNKLNGWQRLWLLAAVALQIFMVFQWSVLHWPARSCREFAALETDPQTGMKIFGVCAERVPYLEVLMNDLQLSGIALGVSIAFYAAAYVAVIIVRWVISGFKK